MDTKEVKYTYVEYDEIWKNDSFPKSRGQFVSQIVKENIKGFKKNFPKNIIAPILISIIVFLAIVVGLAMGVNSFYMGVLENESIVFHFVPYILPGIVDANSYLEGFTHYTNSVNSMWIVYPFYMIFFLVVKEFFKTLFGKNNFKELLINTKNSKKNRKAYKTTCDANPTVVMAKGLFVAFMTGLIIKNPFTILFLAIFFRFVYLKNSKSNLVQLILMWRVTGNLKKGKLSFISYGKLMLEMRSLAIGYFSYFVICSIIWFAFGYSIWARLILTLLFAMLFIFLIYQGRVPKSAVTISMITMMLMTVLISSYIVLGDDGGWAESGGNFFTWLANAGSKVMAALGLGGGISVAIGYAIDSAIAQALGTLGPLAQIVSMAQLLAGFGKPVGSREANLTFAQAALNSAFGPIGPLGGMLGDAVAGIDSAMRGEGAGSTGSGSAGSSGGSEGGSGSSSGNSGSNPGGNSGSNPGGNSGSNPGGNSGSNPGGNSGSNPGGNSGSNPGGNSGSNPGGNSGSDPGGNSGSDPGGNSGGDPGGNSGSDPGGFPTDEEVGKSTWERFLDWWKSRFGN